MIISEVTSGVEVSVRAMYLPNLSFAAANKYVFAYKIAISNHNSFSVQLLRRKWIITEGVGDVEVIEGEGVVGVQPTLESGEEYEYQSGATLQSSLGRMHGFYFFENKITGKVFKVHIPEFQLEATEILN
ncbi:MAG TPA: Co2+/Mg2+ efflux protein ApaG [Chitinophagales bacterium]